MQPGELFTSNKNVFIFIHYTYVTTAKGGPHWLPGWLAFLALHLDGPLGLATLRVTAITHYDARRAASVALLVAILM